MATITKPMADAIQKHAAKCNKHLGECAVCIKNMEWFASLPLLILSEVLAEPYHPKLKQPMMEVAASKLIDDLEGKNLSGPLQASIKQRIAAARLIAP